MHFLIVGPGAMGCLFGAALKKAGFRVTLLDYRRERADEINRQGIHVEGVSGEYTEMVPVVTESIPEAPDAVLFCVKSYSTETAAQGVRNHLHRGSFVLTVQNGVGNVEILERIFGKQSVLGGVTSEGATLLGPGKIRHAGRGETILGSGEEAKGPADRIVSALKMAGFQARSADNIQDLIWGKLIINVGINALTAITRLKNGLLPHIEGTRLVMEEAVREAVAVAHAKGIRLPYPDPLSRVMEVCRATAGNIASMLQDVLRERATEVDFINGAIVMEGRDLGIPTPINLTLTSLVRAIQESYSQRI